MSSLMGSGLRCRKVERIVSGAEGKSHRHVLHHSKQPREACYQSPRHVVSTTGMRRGPVVLHSSPQHHASPEKKRPQHQRVIAVVPRRNTVSRLDLSDLCFVDDLVSLLIFLKEEPTFHVC